MGDTYKNSLVVAKLSYGITVMALTQSPLLQFSTDDTLFEKIALDELGEGVYQYGGEMVRIIEDRDDYINQFPAIKYCKNLVWDDSDDWHYHSDLVYPTGGELSIITALYGDNGSATIWNGYPEGSVWQGVGEWFFITCGRSYDAYTDTWTALTGRTKNATNYYGVPCYRQVVLK